MAQKKTDRQTNGKTTRWAITVYENQWPLIKPPPAGITWLDGQYEVCPETGRKHLQGAMITREQHRWSGCKGDYKVAKTLTQQLPGVHIEPADNWQKLLQYCKKEDTRAPGTQFEVQTNSIPDHFQYAEDCGKRIYDKFKNTLTKDEILIALEILIGEDIMAGKRYAAWITTNPMWKVMWNKWARQFVFSFSNINNGAQEEPRSEEVYEGPGQEGTKQSPEDSGGQSGERPG